jgi:hypothetical protein
MCFLCADSVTDVQQIRKASTLGIKVTLLEHCGLRGPDEWSDMVLSRLNSCNDLVAEEAVYHVRCYSRFTRNKTLKPSVLPGRPEDVVMFKLFGSLCEWLESNSDCELYTLDELRQHMVEEYVSNFCDMNVGLSDRSSDADNAVYSVKQIKRKLRERYKQHIFFAEVAGRKNVVCFRDMCSYIINSKWYSEKKTDTSSKAERIVKLAGKLIGAQLRELAFDSTMYPNKDDMTNCDGKYVPSLLQTLISSLVQSKLQQSSIGQCIVQASRPRSYISPMLLGLALKLDGQHGSQDLLMTLSRLGFSSSYDEVVRYKQSVVMAQNPQESRSGSYPPVFTQWVGDNVDHNIRTLDGLNTFHGMGLISISASPEVVDIVPDKPIPRLKSRQLAAVTKADRGIPLMEYECEKQGLSTVQFSPVDDLLKQHTSVTMPSIVSLDLVWHLKRFFGSSDSPCPNWLGFMQNTVKGQHNPPAVVDMLPLIDKKSTDESCIYSTLIFVCNQARKQGVTPCITF